MSRNELDTQLRQVFNFATSDLEANRKGKLSPRQQKALLERLGNVPQNSNVGKTIAIVMLIVLALGIAALFLFAGAAMQALWNTPIVKIAAGIIFPVIVVISSLTGGIERRARRVSAELVADPSRATVLNVNGAVQKIVIHGSRRGGTSYYLKIDKQTLMITNKDQFDVFQDNTSYRIYYVDLITMPYLVAAELAS